MLRKRNTTFKGDVLRLVSGTGLAQMIGLAAAPILTRLYEPEAFGQAAMFAAITAFLAIVACLSYEYAIVSPKSDKQAANLLVISIVICGLFAGGVVAPLMFFKGDTILAWVNMKELGSVLWVIPVMVWIGGTFQALNYWNTRTRHFARLSISRVVGATAATGSSLGLGFSGFTTGGHMIAAQTGGQAISAAALSWQIYRDNGSFIKNSLSRRRIKVLLKRYRNFPLYYTGSNLVNTISTQLPIVLLGFFFSPAIIGFYALALRLLQAPMSLLGGAISQVFHEKSASANIDGTLSSLVTSTFEKLVGFGVFPILLTGLFAIDIFSFVFGEKWAQAGLFAGILSPWVASLFISSPISILTAVLDLQRVSFIFSVVGFVLRAGAIFIGGYYRSVTISLVLFSASGVLIYLTKCLVLNWYAKVRPAKTLGIILKHIWMIFIPYAFVFFFRGAESGIAHIQSIFAYILFGFLWIILSLKKIKAIGR